MTRARTSEAQLAAVVIHWLEALGADVYQEVEIHTQGHRADIVARIRSEIWIVETKASMSLAVIEQAMDRRRHAHRVYIAAPLARARAGRLLCSELGIGLLEVSADSYDGPMVRQVCASRRWNQRPVALAARLQPEHKTHARAGAPTGGHWSPFRKTIELLAARVAKSPGLSVKDAVNSIEHHYRNNTGARTSLATWIREGKVPGVRIEDGKLWPT